MTPREYLAIGMSVNTNNENHASQQPQQQQQQIQYPFHVEITEDSKGLAKVTASVRSFTSADDARKQCVELFINTKNDLKTRGVKVAE
jgi:hypothetical protein